MIAESHRKGVKETAKLPSEEAVPFYVPTVSEQMSFSRSTSLSACGIVSVLAFGHSKKCVVITHMFWPLHNSVFDGRDCALSSLVS